MEKCPFCGAKKEDIHNTLAEIFPEFFVFSCETNGCTNDIKELDRSEKCYEAQIAVQSTLLESILERAVKRDYRLWVIQWQGNLLDDIIALLPRLEKATVGKSNDTT